MPRDYWTRLVPGRKTRLSYSCSALAYRHKVIWASMSIYGPSSINSLMQYLDSTCSLRAPKRIEGFKPFLPHVRNLDESTEMSFCQGRYAMVDCNSIGMCKEWPALADPHPDFVNRARNLVINLLCRRRHLPWLVDVIGVGCRWARCGLVIISRTRKRARLFHLSLCILQVLAVYLKEKKQREHV
jgi:hypothetical protein